MKSFTLSDITRATLVGGMFVVIASLLVPNSFAEATYGWDWDYDWNQQPTCTLNVNDTNVDYNGTVILTWNSEHASEATLTDFGSVPTSGTKTVHNMTNTRTFTLTVSKDGKSATCSKTVYVETQQQPTCWINANPSNVSQNNNTTLSWGSSNASSASITDIGSVANSGSRTVYPGNSRTYTMTVYNSSGQSNTCQTHVTVDNYQGGTPSCSISLSYNNYYNNYNSYYYNRPATLTWNSYGNATSAYITPSLGSVATNGSQTVYPGYNNQVYTMTVYGANGQSNTCQTSYYYPPQQYLSCTLTSSPDIVTPGGSAVLKWTVNGNARSATLSGVGAVSANSATKVVYPGYSQTYTLTVQDYQGTTRTCSTYVAVGGSTYVPPYTYTTPNYTYPTTLVTLNQVPYTGLDFGPFGTALYFLTIATIIVGAGYGLFFWHGGIFSFASTGSSHTSHINTMYDYEDEDEEEEDEDEEGSAPVALVARTHDTLSLTTHGEQPRIEIKRTTDR